MISGTLAPLLGGKYVCESQDHLCEAVKHAIHTTFTHRHQQSGSCGVHTNCSQHRKKRARNQLVRTGPKGQPALLCSKFNPIVLSELQAMVQVIDAEMQRRKLLEDTPIDSIYGAPVNFDTQSIPWWAWVRRFHLPEVSTPPPLPPQIIIYSGA